MTIAEDMDLTWETLRLPSNLVNHPKYGDLMAVDVFVTMVESGVFIDYDGFG